MRGDQAIKSPHALGCVRPFDVDKDSFSCIIDGIGAMMAA